MPTISRGVYSGRQNKSSLKKRGRPDDGKDDDDDELDYLIPDDNPSFHFGNYGSSSRGRLNYFGQSSDTAAATAEMDDEEEDDNEQPPLPSNDEQAWLDVNQLDFADDNQSLEQSTMDEEDGFADHYFHHNAIIAGERPSINYPKLVPSFNILDVIDALIESASRWKMPDDAHMPLCEGSEISKAQFSTRINALCENFKRKATKVELFDLLYETLGLSNIDIDLPVRTTQRRVVRWTTDEYDYAHTRLQTIQAMHICVKGCVAFASHQLKCPNCKETRFEPCSGCRKKGLAECQCPMDSRTPRKALFYRGLCNLLSDLLNLKWFVPALHFRYRDGDGKILRDYNHSPAAREAMDAMEAGYAEFCTYWNDDDHPQPPVSVPLLLSLFYDGGQVYRTKVSTFWPLVVGIENLPPHIRGDLGSGRFMLALFTAKKDSASEEFLIRDCLVPELERLYRGWLTKSLSGRQYFVQARVVLHLLDTRAMEKYLKVATTGTYAACYKCRCVMGTRPAIMERNVMYNHRILCDERHFSRFFGQTQWPAPPGYYDRGEQELQTDAEESYPKMQRQDGLSPYKVHLLDFATAAAYIMGKGPGNKHLLLKRPGMAEVRDHQPTLCEFIIDRAEKNLDFRYVNYHSQDDETFDFKHTWVQEQLYYRFCELRPQREHSFISDATFLNDGQEAETRGNDASVNGVKGVPRIFQLPYVSLMDVPCDEMHFLGNITRYLLSYLDNTRNFSVKVRQYCSAIACHKHLVESDTKSDATRLPAWAARKTQLYIIEAFLNSIVIPKGRSKDLQLRNVFTQKGKLRCATLVQLSTCGIFEVMMLLLTRSTKEAYPLPYKAFCWLFSRLISDLHADEIDVENDVPKLRRRAIELVVLKEGLFPESEGVIVWHQLIDAVLHITRIGPLRGTSTRSGERVVGQVTDMMPRGGYNPDKTLFSKYISVEFLRMQKTYHSNPDIFGGSNDKGVHVLDHITVRTDQLKRIEIIDRYIKLSKIIVSAQEGLPAPLPFDRPTPKEPQPERILRLTVYDMTGLCKELMKYIRDYCIPHNAAAPHPTQKGDRKLYCLKHFSLFRIMYFHKVRSAQDNSNINKNFRRFVKSWASCISNHQPIDGYQANMVSLASFLETGGLCNAKTFKEHFKRGRFFHEDLSMLVHLHASGMVFALYQNADCMGISFQGRGIACRETSPTRAHDARRRNAFPRPTDYCDNYGSDKIPKSAFRFRPSNSRNRLANHWQGDLKEKCWCKLKRRPGSLQIRTECSAEMSPADIQYAHYGCINFFMQLILSEDVLACHPEYFQRQLNGATFVSTTCRKAPYVERVPVVSGWDAESFCMKHSFVSLRRIEISNVAGLAFDRGNPVLGLEATGDNLPRSSEPQFGLACPPILRTNGLFNPLLRALNIGKNFSPFYQGQKDYDAKEEVEELYSRRNKTNLGGLFMFELDRGHVGTKPWSELTVSIVNNIDAFSRESAVQIII